MSADMNEFPMWTLAEANAALGEVIRLTELAQAQLRELEAIWGAFPFKKFDVIHGVPQEDLIRAQWAQSVAALGVIPKGFFVVDFQSPDPDTLYCWSDGESAIEHEHKIWETFLQRRRIADFPQS